LRIRARNLKSPHRRTAVKWRPGFAGIPNPLFADGKTIMLFGDGREMVQAVMKALKEG
jgi:NAD/NADP transhydrogenase beta subunit